MRRLDYSLRPATEDDLAQVVEIEKVSIRPPWSEASFRGELGKKHAHFWVVTDDETDENIYAYAVFSFPAEQAHLQTVAVHPERRRSGLAKHVMRQLLAYVIREGGESVILEVRKGNAPAIQLYQGLGFVVVHTLPKLYPDGEDAYVMVYKTEAQKITGSEEEEPDSSGAAESNGKKNFTGRRALRSDS